MLNEKKGVRISIIVMLILRFWLSSGFSTFTFSGSMHDDQGFIRMANEITKGSWLGSYGELTLIKYPGTAIWHFLWHTLGIPEDFIRLVTYSFSCLLIFVVSKPLFKKDIYRLIIFGLLIFHPVLAIPEYLRMSRDALLMIFFLLSLSAFINVYINNSSKSSWIRYLSITFCWLFFIREENKLLLPIILGFQAYWFYNNYSNIKLNFKDWRQYKPIYSPWVWLIGVSIVLSSLNYLKYNKFIVCERTTSSFNKAVGALYRAGYNNSERYLILKKADRELLYKHSPSFKELKPTLEGSDIFKKNLVSTVDGSIHFEHRGWLEWAFRASAHRAGYFDQTAKETLDYYDRLSNEINSLCDKGIIKSDSKAYSLPIPIYKDDYLDATIKSFKKGFNMIYSLNSLNPSYKVYYSPGNINDYLFCKNYTHVNASPHRSMTIDENRYLKQKNTQVDVLNLLHFIYKYISIGLGLLLPFSLLISIFSSFKKRTLDPGILITCLLIYYILARIAALAYIDATLYNGMNNLYLMILFPIATFVISFNTLKQIDDFRRL